MASLRFKQNIKKHTSKPQLMTAAEGALVGPVYTLVPTLFGLDGVAGMVVGGLSAWLIGAAFDMGGMCAGAAAAVSTHLMYSHAGQPVIDTLGKPIWRYDAAAPLPPGGTPVYGIQDRDLIQLDNGDSAYGYRSSDLPSQALSDRFVGAGGLSPMLSPSVDATFGREIY